jgi:hypothetical protein
MRPDSAFAKMKLSPNFSLWEFTTSQTAVRQGIDNTPSDEVIKNLRALCEQILEPARAALGPLRISSGYRSPALNTSIGGSKTSAHVFGFAADVIPLQTSTLAFAKWVAANRPFDQIILEFGSPSDPAWIHVSSDPKQRKQILKTVAGGGYAPAQL